MTRIRLQLLAGASAAGIIAGCGVTSTARTSSEPAAALRSDRGMVQFAHCMRAHGINMPDPFHRPGHEGLTIELPEQGPATADAYNACGRYLQATIELKEQSAAQRITPAIHLELIRYAECMRTHAIAMLDPGPMGQLALGNVPGISNGLGRYTPQFRTADQACRHLLPASIHDDGSGP
jgi:hypothetical protein